MKILHIILIIVLSISLTACNSSSSTTSPLSRTNYVFGTIATITLYDHKSETLLDNAFNLLTQLENMLSINQDHTLLSQINKNAGISPVQVDSSTYQLIQKGLDYSALSNGAFDITIGPLVKLWDIGFSSAHLPSQTEINTTLPLIDYNNVILNETACSVYLAKKNMLLDLGGIGKGYAADEVASLLRNAGVEHAIINLGGNIYTIGNHPDHKPWTIGIQDPFNPRGETIGSIQVTNQSIVTSGIYERYFTTEDGTTYHHILNPSTGYPFNNTLAGVTIISDYSVDGDALSTTAFALGLEDGLTFIEEMENIEAIFITTNKEVYLSSGLTNQFCLTNSSFILCH